MIFRTFTASNQGDIASFTAAFAVARLGVRLYRLLGQVSQPTPTIRLCR